MQDRSASWLDARLGADPGWSELSDTNSALVVDDGALAAVFAPARLTSSDEPGVVVDEGTWLASASVAGAGDLDAGDRIVLVADELDEGVADTLDDGLGTAFDVGGTAGGEADDGDAVSGIVDPFDVFIAETAGPTESAAVEEPTDADASPVADSADPVGPATAPSGPAMGDTVDHVDDVDDPPIADRREVVDDETVSDDGRSSSPEPATATSASRLDAFDVDDAPAAVAPGDENEVPFGAHDERDGYDVHDEPFGTDDA